MFAGPNPFFAMLSFTVINVMAFAAILSYGSQLGRQGHYGFFLFQVLTLLVVDITFFQVSFSDPGTIPSRKFLALTTDDKLNKLDQFTMTRTHWLVV